MENNNYLTDEIRTELKEKYITVKKLLDEDSKNDSDREPFKSKYAAMEILKNMQIILFNSVTNIKQQENDITFMLACVYLYQGTIAIDTEEIKSGQDYLTNCLEIINKHELNSKTILILISVLNQLGILWSKRDQPSKAEEYLKFAEKVFNDYKNLQKSQFDICNMSNLFGIMDDKEPKAIEVIERLHTLTLYYLAQVYGSLDNSMKSAIYCHMTLKRQLELNNFESIDWALNAATLSQFFMGNGSFQLAKHHLAASTYILEKYEESLLDISLKIQMEDNKKEILESKWENFNYRRSDILRCWAKYGILLMSKSRERLISINENVEDKVISNSTNFKVHDIGISQEYVNKLKFNTIENNLQDIANKITDKYLLDFNDAKEVFLIVKKWLDNAKSYFTLENHASDYVQIINDMSLLYKYLAFFEEDENRQVKMHKRRINLLENIVKALNEKYYQSMCQQIWIELGEIYSEILDIKLDNLRTNDKKPTCYKITKINNLTNSAIENFKKFVNSVMISGNMKFSEEMIRPVLCTYFHLGRLYNKFIISDKQTQLENIKNSLDAYRFLINYCEKDLKAADLMSVELNICKDFIRLLPIKMNKLINELSNLERKL